MNRIPSDAPLSIAVCNVPPKAGPDIYILRLKGAERYSFTVLSKALFGLWVHWSGTRSEPHYTDDKRCPGCKNEYPKRWKGFLHCYCIEKKQFVFLELTPASAKSFMDQLAPGESIRGIGLVVNRTKGDNGRLNLRTFKHHDSPEKLPQDLDPLPSLLKIWGIQPGDSNSGREFPTSTNGFLVANGHECL